MFSFDQCEKYVISLDHREDRRQKFFDSLGSLGYPRQDFQWVVAIEDNNFGGLGCAKSHLKTLANFITESNKPYCAIFEDDFAFRKPKELVEIIIQALDDKTTWDVFLFSGTELRSFSTGYSLHNHMIDRVFDSVTASGYLVTRQYAQVLIQNLLESIVGMEKYKNIEQRKLVYHKYALDRTWQRLQSRDSWFCTQPMLGQQLPSFSDIEKKLVNYSEFSS
jgi:GR25 family glycosyltransferase involved in LPS biosynthesis